MSEKFRSRPQYVPMMELNISPRPAGTKKAMKITPVATIRSFTQADTASERRDSIRIQIAEHTTIGTTIHTCDHSQPFLASPACRPNKNKQGIQVTPDSSKASTESFPSTYSALLNGRLRKSGRAPLVKSPAIKTGPTQQFKRKAACVCTIMMTMKYCASTTNKSAERTCISNCTVLLLAMKM